MKRSLRFTPTAAEQLKRLEDDPSAEAVLKQVRKTLGLLETNTKHPGLQTHEYESLKGANGEKVWEAYARNRTPGAYRVFFHYGPDEYEGKERIPILTIFAMVPHPK